MTTQPPGWYPAQGDPPGTQRYWDGSQWTTGPQPVGPSPTDTAGGATPPTPGDQFGAPMAGSQMPGQSMPGAQFGAPMPGGQMPGSQMPGQAGFSAAGANAVVGGRQLATPWMRVAARLIDGIIFFMVTAVIGLVLFVALLGSDADVLGSGASKGQFFVAILLSMAYEFIFVSQLGGTPGKLLLGMEVVGEADGQRAEVVPAALRALVWSAGRIAGLLVGWFQAPIWLIVVVGGLVLLFTDDRHQSVADKAAKTVVVQK